MTVPWLLLTVCVKTRSCPWLCIFPWLIISSTPSRFNDCPLVPVASNTPLLLSWSVIKVTVFACKLPWLFSCLALTLTVLASILPWLSSVLALSARWLTVVMSPKVLLILLITLSCKSLLLCWLIKPPLLLRSWALITARLALVIICPWLLLSIWLTLRLICWFAINKPLSLTMLLAVIAKSSATIIPLLLTTSSLLSWSLLANNCPAIALDPVPTSPLSILLLCRIRFCAPISPALLLIVLLALIFKACSLKDNMLPCWLFTAATVMLMPLSAWISPCSLVNKPPLTTNCPWLIISPCWLFNSLSVSILKTPWPKWTISPSWLSMSILLNKKSCP